MILNPSAFLIVLIGVAMSIAGGVGLIRAQIDARKARRAELDRRVSVLLARPVRRR